MNQRTRTDSVRLNAKTAVVSRIVTLVCNFAVRSVFIKSLGSEYLGAGGMFGNVFAVLSLCELGFGEAVSQAMYKPIASGDRKAVCSLVKYYACVYRYIALISLAGSLAAMPFLPAVFPDIAKIENYRIIYLLFVFHQTVSYIFAPKRSLVACDQKMYILSACRTAAAVVISAAQIFWLIKFGSYTGYIFIRIAVLAADGIIIERYAVKKYGFDNCRTEANIDSLKKKIKNNVGALALHRIGGVINSSTDSILLSSCLGLSEMGVFSNYSLIINSLGSFIGIAVNSASASVGNLGTDENPQKSEKVLLRLCFADFVLVANCSAVLLCTINPIITLWIGEELCFGFCETLIIISCFYISYVREPIQVFLHSYGVFKSTKYIPLARGVLNLVISYALVKKYGVAGVFGGTLISTVAVPFFWEPYALFKHGFGKECKPFLIKYVGYTASAAIICMTSCFLCGFIYAGGILGIFLKIGISVSLTNAVIVLIYGKSREFQEICEILFSKFRRKKGKPVKFSLKSN